MVKLKLYYSLCGIIAFILASCTDVDIMMPKGPKGDAGLSAYEVWKEKVLDGTIKWSSKEVEIADFFKYLKGADGKDGVDGKSAYDQWKEMIAQGNVDDPHNSDSKWDKSKNSVQDFWKFLTGASGEDGQTPHVGENGHWYIGDKDTGIASRGENGKDGKDGKDAVPPTVTIGANGNWFVNGTDTGKSAKGVDGKDGKDGRTPSVTIGENGHWYIDGKDSGKASVGKDGKSPEVAIGQNGHWYINGKDTGVSAYGKDGKNGVNGTNGTNGANGTNGKSAYELWKEYISKGDVDDPHNPGEKWPASKNTLNDFWSFLSGKDGKDGADGKPGEMGKPGAEVVIVLGVPNVVAQYSQSEYGEYVRTTDGGVLYKVYDEQGQVAPKATVKGMPGINPDKVYTADDKGEFVVPKEDLPEIQDVESRWGVTKEVTIAGKEPKASARNTYVPNRVHMRMVTTGSSSYSLSNYQGLYFYIQRKLNPQDEWQNIPSYLPYSGSMQLAAYRVSDGKDPKTIMKDKKIYASHGTSSSSNNYYSYYADARRFVEKNPGNFKNNQSDFWDGTDVYYTVVSEREYYGENVQWNGTCLLAPYQMGPILKKLKLKSISSGDEPNFASAEGEFDFSHIDFTRIYKYYSTRKVGENGVEYVTPNVYTKEEALKLKIAYIYFSYSSSAGNQTSSSNQNQSSNQEPGFKAFAPFLNSTISIENSSDCYFYEYTFGTLKRGTGENKFVVVPGSSDYKFPEVEVTYEP